MKKNEKTIMGWLSKGFCALLVAGAVACTGENTTGVDADEAVVDTEEVVDDVSATTANSWDNEQFGSTFAADDEFEEWDASGDGMLDENEYNSGFMETWDENEDNSIDENEWNTAVNDFGIEGETWSEWDTSGDGMLDENEFSTGFADNEWRTNWDTDKDNMISEREYSDGLFGLWDENADGMLDENESRLYETYYD